MQTQMKWVSNIDSRAERLKHLLPANVIIGAPAPFSKGMVGLYKLDEELGDMTPFWATYKKITYVS